MSARSQPVTATPDGATPVAQPSADMCPYCYRTSDMESVEVKRDGKWVASTVRRCVNPECQSVREGSLLDRVAHINSVYGYKYFGDYDLSPEQLDAVGEAVGLANRVPALLEALKILIASIDEMDPEQWHVSTVAYNGACDAIAKAEGK